MNQFKQDLESVMAGRGMTMRAVSRATGVHQSTLSLFLSGARQGISGIAVLKLWPFIYGENAAPRPFSGAADHEADLAGRFLPVDAGGAESLTRAGRGHEL